MVQPYLQEKKDKMDKVFMQNPYRGNNRISIPEILRAIPPKSWRHYRKP